MCVVSEAMKEGAGTGGDGVSDFLRGNYGAQGSVSTREAFGSDEDVGREVPVPNGEVAAGATHPSHHFISNEKHTVTPADFGDFLQIAGRRRDSAQSCAADGLEDEGGGLVIGGEDGLLELGRVLQPAVAAAVGAVELAPVAARHADVSEFLDHRQIDFAALAVAGDGERTQGRTVIALLATQDLVAPGLADFNLVLAGELESGLDGFRSAGGEVDGTSPEVRPGEVEKPLRVLLGNRCGEL